MPQRIAIFGSGSAARDLLSSLSPEVEVVNLLDNDIAMHGITVDGHQVVNPDTFDFGTVDYTVIAARAVDSIREQLITRGISEDIVLAFYPSFSQKLSVAANRDIAVLNEILDLKIPQIGLASMYLDPGSESGPVDRPPHDFVRNQTFRLAARQVAARGVSGAVAELGVYQGDQAKLIHELFPDRTLYLFDTFTGFSEKDLGAEADRNFSTAVVGDFHNTSLSLVMSKLANPDKVKACQGYFPESAAGVDERFAFVSLDVDLYEPTLAGLEWFYEKLNTGGYIFVHDYNNKRYLGVKGAVDQFVKSRGACCVPIADFAGSMIIMR